MVKGAEAAIEVSAQDAGSDAEGILRQAVQQLATGSSSEAAQSAQKAAAAARAAKSARIEAESLLLLSRARSASGDCDGAMAAARRASLIFKDLPENRSTAQALSMIANEQFRKGYWELSLKAAREAREALGDDETSTDVDGVALVSKIESLIVQAHHARGEEPPKSLRRAATLEVLQSLGLAFESRDSQPFQEALANLRRLGAYSETDVNRVLAPVLEADSEAGQAFLDREMTDRQMLSSYYDQYDRSAEVCSLRAFPCHVKYQRKGYADEGSIGNTWWWQTQGQIVFNHPLSGPRPGVSGGWVDEDIVVQIADRELKVTLGDEPVRELSGELFGRVWRKDSWWEVDRVSGELIITLFKRDLNTWKGPWYAPGQEYKRTPFPWNDKQKLKIESDVGNVAEDMLKAGRRPRTDIPDETDLEPILPGRPEPEEDQPVEGGGYIRSLPGGVFAPQGDKFICRAEDVCLGISIEQDVKHIYITVHFERFAYEDLRMLHPIEKLLAVDVWHNAVCVFLQGDKQNPIIWGELSGECLPYCTVWRMGSSETFRTRQEVLGNCSPSLMVQLQKRSDHFGQWPKVFKQCTQARLLRKQGQNQPRHQGLSDVPTARRAGYDLGEPDFWSLVDDYCRETVKKTGCRMAPQKMNRVA